MKLRIVAAVVLICGACLLAGSMIRGQKTDKKGSTESRSFVVQYLASRSEDGGSLTPYEYRVRAVSSSGEWKETRYSFDGGVSTWGAARDGLYVVRANTRQYYGEHDLEFFKAAMRSEEGFKASPQLKRTEQLAGLRTYVLRNQNGTEISYSPATGMTSLKEVVHLTPDSDEVIHLVEALKVEFRDLSQDESRLPDLPIRFDVAEQKVQSLKAAGNIERAQALQEGIDRLKASNK